MTQLTDDQIIAAAGEPVAWRTWYPENPKLRGYWSFASTEKSRDSGSRCPDGWDNLYSADQLLSAVKPLRERIAELEAEIKGWKEDQKENMQIAVDLHQKLNAALARENVMRKYAMHKCSYEQGVCDCGLSQLLALPHDDTALRQIVEDEREACAKVCEKEAVQIVVDGPEERAYNNAVTDCSAAIRARSN